MGCCAQLGHVASSTFALRSGNSSSSRKGSSSKVGASPHETDFEKGWAAGVPSTVPEYGKHVEADSLNKKEDMSERMLAYAQKKAARKQVREALMEEGGVRRSFLSNLPEVEADIRYRFNFIVSATGHHARKIAETVCSSDTAKSMPAMSSEQDEPASSSCHQESCEHHHSAASAECSQCEDRRLQGFSSSHTSKGAAGALSCLCKLDHAQFKNPMEKSRLAKLAFQPLFMPSDIVPICHSRLEALSTALVYVLIVDQGQHHLRAQLRHLAASVDSLRGRCRSRNRPVRAAILCYTEEQDAHRQDQWVHCMADFEQGYGHVWKFGPIGLWEAEGLHAIFTEIAATRIAFGHGSHARLEEPDGPDLHKFASGDSCQEGHDEDEEIDEGLDQLDLSGNHVGKISHSEVSRGRGSSSSSADRHRPPVFASESEGSACSDEALQKHQQFYGAGSAGSGPQFP